MTSKDKLLSFKEKILKTEIFNQKFGEFVAIEVLDFITKNNDLLAKEFYRHLNYLKDLGADHEFNKLQDDLFGAIQKILKLVTIKEVEEMQLKFNNRLFFPLKKADSDDGLDLPAIYKLLQKKEHYYRLGDNSYFSPLEGEISTHIHVIPVKKQYEKINDFLQRIVYFVEKKDEKMKDKLDELCAVWNNLCARLEEKIYRIPKNDHYEEFESFFYFCTLAYEQPGHSLNYQFHRQDFYYRDTERKLKNIKQHASVVIDDLVDYLDKFGTKDSSIKSSGIIKYEYNDTQATKRGLLSVGDCSPLSFAKLPAQILFYFYSRRLLDNAYTTYHTFLAYSTLHDDKLDSDIFRRKIREINERVKNHTQGIILNLIEQEAGTKKQQANRYRWNEKFL